MLITRPERVRALSLNFSWVSLPLYFPVSPSPRLVSPSLSVCLPNTNAPSLPVIH